MRPFTAGWHGLLVCFLASFVSLLVGCDGPSVASADAGRVDAGAIDAAGSDAARSDAGRSDAGVASMDSGTIADAGPDASSQPACTDPPGSACNPIVIDALPFSHAGDTSASAEDMFDVYSCAAAVDEQGPEVHYELRLAEPSNVSLAVEEASGVDVDVHVLREARADSCLARANTSLEQALGAGVWRLTVDTFYGGGTERAGAYTLRVSGTAPAPRSVGTMWNTYYFLADEDDHTGAQDTPIYDADCVEIARVRQAFHDSVCIEGSGLLSDDRVINYATGCTTSCPAARRCGGESYRICYSVLDSDRYPWGQGAGSRALVPDRSMAVDRDFIALGSWVYFAQLDGLARPGTGEVHDGCLRADDVGGGIAGDHFDFFAGSRSRWLEWEALLPTRSTLDATVDDPRCYPSP